MSEHNTCMQAGYTVYCIILFADVSEPDICNAGDWDEQVTERQQNAHEETSSDDETGNAQIEGIPDSHKMQPAGIDPHEAEKERCNH